MVIIITETTQPRASFDDSDTRVDEMHRTIEAWIDELAELTDESRASEAFQRWLDVQSRIHGYSYRNTLLIHHQCPESTRAAGYRTWQTEFDRNVRKGEQAIWIWAQIIAKRCLRCGNSRSYHEQSDCEYDETPPVDWSNGLVGFRPVPVFDVSKTEGEPLPELETAAAEEAADLVPALDATAEALDVSLRLVPGDEWSRGKAKGVCQWPGTSTGRPHIEVQAGLLYADLAVTLVHEYAHALLHVDEREEQAKREVEAEAVAYVVDRYFGLDVGGSAFYLAAWSEEASSQIEKRLEQIGSTAGELIESIDH